MAFITSKQVTIAYEAASREDALHYLAEQGVALGFAEDVEAVYQAFLEREAIAETGLQDGCAVPHAKTDAIKTPGVAVVKLANKVEWPSFDKQPVDIALALYVPAGEAGTTHLQLLSKVAVLLMDEGFRSGVQSADGAEKIAELINAGIDEA